MKPKKMNCHEYEKELMLFHAGELPLERKAALDRHLQVCRDCAAYNHAMANTVHAVADGRIPEISVNLWPRVASGINGYHFFCPRWVLVPALSLLLLGALFSKVVMRSQPQVIADIEVVNEMDFLADYDLWKDLDTLEKSENIAS